MSVDPALIATAQAQLARLGVTVADLRRAERPPVPTVVEFLPRVVAAAGVGSLPASCSYWQRMALVWGDRPLDTIAASDVETPATACDRGGDVEAKRSGWPARR